MQIIFRKFSALFPILFLLAAPLFGQTTHTVKVAWTDTVNPAGTQYNVYRASAACSTNPTLTKLTATPLSATSFTDSGVTNGTTFCYAVTAVGPGGESAFSNEAPAIILAPPNAITITVTVS